MSDPTTSRVASATRSLVDDIFGVDARALAVMRIGLGLIMLRDLWVRSYDLVAFYSDRGAIPREAVLDHLNRSFGVSVHMAAAEWQVSAALFAIHAVFAAMFTVGFRTRLATAVSWFLLISLQTRAGIVLQAGDVVLRLLMFWALLLPMSARVSVDAWRQPPPKGAPGRVTSIATAALGVQLASIYLFTWILKSGRHWWDGSAVYYALNIDYFGKQPFCSMLLGTAPVVDVLGEGRLQWLESHVWAPIAPNVPWATSALTFGTFFWELAGPVLLLFPFFRAPVRTLVVFGFISLHLGFFAGLEIGLFPWICIAGWAALLPGAFWDRLGWRDDAPTRARVHRSGWALNAAAFFFLVLVTNWNLSTIKKQVPAAPSVPSEVRWVAKLLRLDQTWNMFAPYPLKDDGWYVIPGVLFNGEDVDLWTGGTPKWVPVDTADGHKPLLHHTDEGLELDRTKPELVSAMYPSQRWRKYMRNIWLKKYKDVRIYYGKHLCRTWNAEHTGGERLRSFRIVYMKEVTPKPGGDLLVRPTQIWQHNCYSSTKTSSKTAKPAPKTTPSRPEGHPSK